MPDSFDVLPVGSAVRVGGEIDAVVNAIMIRGKDVVQYECVWWDGNTHHSKWLHDREVQPTSEETLPIGFRRVEEDPFEPMSVFPSDNNLIH